MNPPLVSVLMPVRNCASHVRDALASILGQTVADLEVIVIDDASTDDTVQTIQAVSDPRVLVHRNSVCRGISQCLNTGIDLSKGRFLARMDGDDISLPNRFSLQLKFLETHPTIDICGGGIQLMGGGKKADPRFPLDPEGIRAGMLFNNVLSHPTIMGHRHFFDRFRYDPEFLRAQDYELWTRCMLQADYANLPVKLLRYRIHDHQVSSGLSSQYKHYLTHIVSRNLSLFDIHPDGDTFASYLAFLMTPGELTQPGHVGSVSDILQAMLRSNAKSVIMAKPALRRAVSQVWLTGLARTRLSFKKKLAAILSTPVGHVNEQLLGVLRSAFYSSPLRNMRGDQHR